MIMLRKCGICCSRIINQAYYVEILKRLCEILRIKRPELWPNDWIFHRDNAPAHKALSVTQFLSQKSITEVEYIPFSSYLAPNCFSLFPKIKSALKGRRFQDIKVLKKTWRHWKQLQLRSFKTVFNNGSIIRLSAQVLSGGTSKVTPLSKL
jgi:hypothetical protein